MSRRSRFDIYVDILTEIKNGTILPTRIMYGTNMSWGTLIKTLKSLTAQGLIEEQSIERKNKTKNIYTLTNKGNSVLKYLNLVNELVEMEQAIEIPT